METSTVAIVQARMGSTRLPGKTLKLIGDKPMLEHVIERCRAAATLDEVIVATSDLDRDDEIVGFCRNYGIDVFRGKEEDVLGRYRNASIQYDVNNIVRITADCPFITPGVIDRNVRVYIEEDDEFVTNTLYYTYPDGLDVEVFSKETLFEASELAESDAAREHVTPYMRSSDSISRRNVQNPVELARFSYTRENTVLRWTVDYPEDLKFVRSVYDELCTSCHSLFGQIEILELLERKPELLDINENRTREW